MTWRTVDVDGCGIRLMESGDGEPTLFLHGWGLTPDAYEKGIARLTAGGAPAEIVHGRHNWLLTEPEEFATILRDALVIHAMLERSLRGQSLRLPAGVPLSDFIPPERRTFARHEP